MAINANNLEDSYIYPIIYPDNIVLINETINKDFLYQIVLNVVYKFSDFVYELATNFVSVNWDFTFICLSICIMTSVLYERIKDKHGEELNKQMMQIRYLSNEICILNDRHNEQNMQIRHLTNEVDNLIVKKKMIMHVLKNI